jgi:hypothetical protein
MSDVTPDLDVRLKRPLPSGVEFTDEDINSWEQGL